MSASDRGVPQVVAILSCSADGRIRLKKALRTYLGLAPGQGLVMSTSPQIVVRASGRERGQLALDDKGRVCLPAPVLSKLGITGKSLVAFVERPGGAAVKRFEVLERAASWARLVDVEAPHMLARIAYTNPPPAELLPDLIARHRGARLRRDVRAFLRERPTYEAWQACRILGEEGAPEEMRRRSLAEERLGEQRADGSWQGRVALTARRLRELADLGSTRADPPVRRAAEWLLSRPESQYNAGMFFGKDELVQEQASVMERLRRGERARFRKILTSEQNLVRAADELVRTPCGPRIMWPNALVVEALLRLGCEKEPRVQRALETMGHEWCECAYQNGSGSWRKMNADELEAFEASCLREFRYGGVRDLHRLAQADMSRVPFEYPRTAHRVTAEGDEYSLEMPRHLQGCEVITTRALSGVGDARLRRFAEAHLWRFASRQRPDGQFAPEKYGSGLSPAGFLEVFARYRHPASQVVAMRAIPWIIDSQNGDGSWGEGASKDADTRAVVSVLASVRDRLDLQIAG